VCLQAVTKFPDCVVCRQEAYVVDPRIKLVVESSSDRGEREREKEKEGGREYM